MKFLYAYMHLKVFVNSTIYRYFIIILVDMTTFLTSKNGEINPDDHPANANTIHVGEKPKSISFSGCGFLGIYHVGVASCIKTHAPNWLKSVDRVYGCSAGSLVAAMLLNDVDFGEACHRLLNIVKDARSRYLGPMSPGFKLNETLLRDMRCGLPLDAHKRASGKLFISLTRVRDGKNVIVNDYKSREELFQVLICSCFVPFYSGIFPPKYRGVRYVDGGLSNNLPAYDDTITVSPWSGNSDICPRNDGAVSLIDLSFVNTSIQLTASNLYRAATMFFPPNPEVLKEFCAQGFRETVQYLRDHGLFETVHPLRNNLSFSSLLHEREERRKITRRMSYNARSFQQLRNEAFTSNKRYFPSSDSESSSGSESNLPGLTLKESALVECFDENDSGCDVDSDPKFSDEKQTVYTVIHVYPALDDHVLRIKFQLPPPMLEALEATLHPDFDTSWKKPFSTLLTSCQQSLFLRIPLDKIYAVACGLLCNAGNIPREVSCFVSYLRQLVCRIQTHLKCSSQEVVEILSTVSGKIRKELQLITCHMIITIRTIVKSLLQHEIYIGAWMTSACSLFGSCYRETSKFNPRLSPFLQIMV